MVDHRWTDFAGTSDKIADPARLRPASNRLWRRDPVAASQSPAVYLDELYSYDGVYQLKTLNRGQLNPNRDGLVTNTKDFAEQWTLDPLGNWTNFKQDATGGGTWTLEPEPHAQPGQRGPHHRGHQRERSLRFGGKHDQDAQAGRLVVGLPADLRRLEPPGPSARRPLAAAIKRWPPINTTGAISVR